MSSRKGIEMNTRRQAFMLAGALTATVFTGAAAFAGISHRPHAAASPAAATPVVQIAQQHQQVPTRWEDD
jgi:hypothetical protein